MPLATHGYQVVPSKGVKGVSQQQTVLEGDIKSLSSHRPTEWKYSMLVLLLMLVVYPLGLLFVNYETDGPTLFAIYFKPRLHNVWRIECEHAATYGHHINLETPT